MKEPEKDKFQTKNDTTLYWGWGALDCYLVDKKKRKTNPKEKIANTKARMNVDGSNMIKGLHYEKTYAPI